MKGIDLMNEYKRRMNIWKQKKGEEEASFLIVDLASWYVKIKPPNTVLWDVMQEHIEDSAKKTGKSEEELMDYLFEAENHEIWMSRFKDLGKEEQ